MRLTVGIVGTLGLGITVAVAAAQGPGGSGANQRGAHLLPPQPIYPSEQPAVVRAAPDDLTPYPATTPVTRPGTTAGAPGWLNGTDPNVRPASGVFSGRQQVSPLTQPTDGTTDNQSLVSKGIGKIKGAFGANDRPDGAKSPGNLPAGVAGEQPNANSPFRGTAANGAPVYAGPPAYRWYGWGSVTPGANPYAPTGQQPTASANWFTITRATPGAFPVPVMNPYRTPPGTEPPAYVAVPNQRIPPVTNYVPVGNSTSRGSPPPADTVASVPPPVDLSRGDAPGEVRATPITTIVPPITVPVLATPPSAIAAPQTAEPEVTARPLPPIPAAPESRPIQPAANLPTPGAFPATASDDPLNWQPATEPRSPGDWGPAGPAHAPGTAPPPNWQQPGASKTQVQPIARGQAEDIRPDPTAALIRRVCEGRAAGVDVRWTGSKKLTVGFACRTAHEAQQLVKDISARPELAPLQIDFSVLVK